MSRVPRRTVWIVAVGLVATLGVVVTVLLSRSPSEAVATKVSFTAKQESRYLHEVKEFLTGRPGHDYYRLVNKLVLVQQGVQACEWLATQPARDHARRDDQLRDRYFADKPQANADWPFKQGRTGLREEIVSNAWWQLCRDIADDHIDHSPIPEDQD